jgi:hypothetical protein
VEVVDTLATTTTRSASTTPDYLDERARTLRASGAQFVVIDLSAKTLEVLEQGTTTLSMPIKAIAATSSWWQTPPGYYEVLSKKPSHDSSFGNVTMPWNLPFQGNFFIHGWPRYASGRPATSAVSGGCIRLREADAKALYELLPVGTPIIITEDRFDSSLTFTKRLTPPPLASEHHLAVDLTDNRALLASGAQEQLPVGDLATLLSALVASEHIGMERSLYAVGDANDNGRIKHNERYRLFDLLFPLLEDWSREPEETVAQYMGEDRFERRLAYKLRALGMDTSHARVATSGVALETTALDLVQLARYTHLYRNFLFEITDASIPIYLYGEPTTGRRQWPRIFPGFEDFRGGVYDQETGSVVALFDLSEHGGSAATLFISLHSDDPLQDVVDMRWRVLTAQN